jgi:hypothetical protein
MPRAVELVERGAEPVHRCRRSAARASTSPWRAVELDDLAADLRLELGRRALGDDPAAVRARRLRRRAGPASSRYCVVRKTVAPWLGDLRMIRQSSCRLRVSRPVVGSSRKITASARRGLSARSSRRRMPPE